VIILNRKPARRVWRAFAYNLGKGKWGVALYAGGATVSAPILLGVDSYTASRCVERFNRAI
jgi:hypothetical protein